MRTRASNNEGLCLLWPNTQCLISPNKHYVISVSTALTNDISSREKWCLLGDRKSCRITSKRAGSCEYFDIISSYPAMNARGPSASCISTAQASLARLPKLRRPPWSFRHATSATHLKTSFNFLIYCLLHLIKYSTYSILREEHRTCGPKFVSTSSV